MATDNRFLFVRNAEAVGVDSDQTAATEYDVQTDADVIGGVEHGPYQFQIWEFSDKKPGEPRKLILRMRERRRSTEDGEWEHATREGYYHGGGIPYEIVALASLFLRRRLSLGPLVRMDDQPMILSSGRPAIDPALTRGQSNLAELATWLPLAEGLEPSCHLRFVLSVRLYHQAIHIIDGEPDLAYLTLVSAIEALCEDADPGEVKLRDVDPALDALVGQVGDEDLRRKIADCIVSRERFIKRRFVRFILDHVEEEFWRDARPQHEWQRVKRAHFKVLLKRVYDQRSKTLHDGLPFPPASVGPPAMDGEIDFSQGSIVGDRKWDNRDYIPYVCFFERVVNHVLKTYLKRHQADPHFEGKRKTGRASRKPASQPTPTSTSE